MSYVPRLQGLCAYLQPGLALMHLLASICNRRQRATATLDDGLVATTRKTRWHCPSHAGRRLESAEGQAERQVDVTGHAEEIWGCCRRDSLCSVGWVLLPPYQPRAGATLQANEAMVRVYVCSVVTCTAHVGLNKLEGPATPRCP